MGTTFGKCPKDEGAADVGGLGVGGEADLGAGAAGAAEDVRAQVCAEDIRQLARDDFRLVVAAPPSPRLMQRDWNDDVHVGELRRTGEALPQHAGEKPPGREPAFVFQVPGDMAVIRVGVVEEKGGGEGVWLVKRRGKLD